MVLYLAAVVFYVTSAKPSDKCSGVEVRMILKPGQLAFMDRPDVLHELKMMNFDLKGHSLERINVYQVEEQLRRNPLFSNTEVYLSPLSHKAVLMIAQKDPFFLVQTGDSLYYVSSDRGIIPCNPKYAVEVPIITGHVQREQALGDLFNLVSVIEESEYWQNFFGQIYVDKQGSVILTPRVSKMNIILGKTPQWRTKLNNLQAFCNQVIPVVGWEAYRSVNLEFNGQVVAKAAAGTMPRQEVEASAQEARNTAGTSEPKKPKKSKKKE